MQHRKSYQIILFVLGCIVINCIGKLIAEKFELPLWLDSMGTVLMAYVFGPVCGAIVGATVNIAYGFYSSVSFIYAFTNIALGILVGICAKKGFLDNLFKTLSLSFLVTVIAVAISTPLNWFFAAGRTGNIWGDGVIDLLQEVGFNKVICCMIGEFYIDFLDKVVTMLLLFVIVKVVRKNKWTSSRLMAGIFLVSVLSCSVYGATHGCLAQAKESGQEDTNNFNTYVQTIYNGENGLPDGKANDVAQTKDGILWVGTYGGLYRYNGSEFQWMNQFESVKNVNCLYTDEAGRLWIGTNDSGLSICINDNISNVVGKEQGLPSDTVRCIAQDTEGNYYVGTTDCLAIVTLSDGLSVCDTIPEIVFANSISTDENGNVAVVTDEGGLYLIRGNQIIAKKKCEQSEDAYTCCSFDESGRLYVGTTSNYLEVYELSEDSWNEQDSIVCPKLSNIKSLRLSEEGYFFVCADNGAGYLDLVRNYRAINTNKFNSSIDHMLTDYQGNLWFTSSRLGLLRLCKSVFTEIYSEVGLSENVVNTIVKWNGNLYFGTDSGLDMVDETITKKQSNFLTKRLKGVRIRCLMVDSNNHLWICTSGIGVLEVKGKGEIKTYNSATGVLGDKFRTVLELKDGTIAAAGDLGISFIRDGKICGTVGSKDGLVNPKVLCMLEREDGSILAGTDGNGIAIINNAKLTGSFKKEDGLGSEVILRMVSDSDGAGIFIVTSNGICFMDKRNKIRVFEDFPYYNNFDIVEGKRGELFVLGSAGIYVVDKENLIQGKKLDYELLNSKKGLRRSLTPNAYNYRDENDNLYLSGDSGVVFMNLQNYDLSDYSYRMILKKIKMDEDDYSVERGETIHIPKGKNRIEIMPEVVNYTINDPYISVYLEGFDKEPAIIPQSQLKSIVYTNLPTGNYTFHMGVLDDKKSTMIEESTYEIVKDKEIYDNWWFLFYVGFVFILVIAYLTWLFARTQIQKTLNFQKKELTMAKQQVQMGNETILTIARTVDAKDENTSQHSVRVSEYSVMIAEKLGYDEQEREELRKTALLHDIGKIAIPDMVLNKPARLTDEEYEIMKSHVTRGAEILKNFTLVEHVDEGALYHHERYDGNGYVHGLQGEEIPLNARIIGIADAFDAMTANRVYRKKLDFAFVLEELKKGRGTQFDPQLVDIMLGLIEDGTIDVKHLYETKSSLEG